MMTSKSPHPIWRGSIAGVMPADKGSRGRLIDTLAAVDKLLEEYPKMGR
jgi:hypothetical protein